MNVLFLFPHPAEDRRELYRSAALTLRERFGHSVLFVYTGRPYPFADDLPTERFEEWVERNSASIRSASLLELEKEFPNSNLWRSLVAQRTLADYSYVGDSFPVRRYRLEEIEFYLKAVVMFYRYVLDRYEIQLAIAQAPDVIHAHVLYELSRSRPFRAINQYYDPYWQRGARYAMDEITFSSSFLRRRYQNLLRDYQTEVLPREAELEEILRQCRQNDPREMVAREGWPTSLRSTFRASWRGLRDRWHDVRWLPVGILEHYHYLSFWVSLRAWAIRSKNLFMRRWFVPFSRALPPRPFVFLALHYQPESATLAVAPVWSDMLALARMLSVSLPSGYQLVVKDHPMVGGYRAPDFYRQVARLPNALVLPENYSTTELLEKCALVATVSGTIGFQALLHAKPVLLFGARHYDCVEGVLRPPADLNDLPVFLKDVLINRHLPDAELRRRSLLAFMAAYRSVLVHNPKMEHGSTPRERGEGLAELIQYWIENDLGLNRVLDPRPA